MMMGGRGLGIRYRASSFSWVVPRSPYQSQRGLATCPHHTACQWQSQDSNPGPLASRSEPFTFALWLLLGLVAKATVSLPSLRVVMVTSGSGESP